MFYAAEQLIERERNQLACHPQDWILLAILPAALIRALDHSFVENFMSDQSKEKFYVPFTNTTGELPESDDFSQPNWELAWNGEKSLWQAAVQGDLAALQSFLAHGVHVDERGNEESTPLICAAGRGHIDAVEFLLDNGADINGIDMFGTTPLMAAAASGNIDMVKLLLERGADVAVKSIRHAVADETALDVAIRNGHTAVAEVLKKHGAT